VIITEDIENKAIMIYSLCLSTFEITKYIKEMYQMDISAITLSSITDKVIPAMNEWRQRPLDSVYAFVYLDCTYYKVSKLSGEITRAVINI
jgi:putative transposase